MFKIAYLKVRSTNVLDVEMRLDHDGESIFLNNAIIKSNWDVRLYFIGGSQTLKNYYNENTGYVIPKSSDNDYLSLVDCLKQFYNRKSQLYIKQLQDKQELINLCSKYISTLDNLS